MKLIYAEGALMKYLAARNSGTASAQEMAALQKAVMDERSVPAAPRSAKKRNTTFSEFLATLGLNAR